MVIMPRHRNCVDRAICVAAFNGERAADDRRRWRHRKRRRSSRNAARADQRALRADRGDPENRRVGRSLLNTTDNRIGHEVLII